MAGKEDFISLRNPAIIMTIVLIVESIILFGWWPKDVKINNVSLVNYLMLIYMVLGIIQCFIYDRWIDKRRADSMRTNITGGVGKEG